MRKPRNLILGAHGCCWKSQRQWIPYGTVWVDIATQAARLPSKALSSARASIAAEATFHDLTFARWAPLTNHWDVANLGYIWHVCAEFVWDDQYEAAQTDT